MDGSSIVAAARTPVRVLLVDAHPVFREGLACVLERESDFEVVGRSGHAAEALDMASRLRPNLATVDLVPRRGDSSANDLTRALLGSCDVKVFGLSMLEHPTRIAELFHAGALGFASKSQPVAELVDAMRMVATGARYIAPWLRADVELLARARALPHETLTPRERRVLMLLLDGLTNDQIALDMAISPRTVDTHRQRLMSKLGVHSITELVRLAARRGEL